MITTKYTLPHEGYTSPRSRAMRDLIYFLIKLTLNKKGRSLPGMSMHKTMSCEPGKYKILFEVRDHEV